MLDEPGQRHRVRRSQLADRALARAQLREDGPAGGVRQRAEDGVERSGNTVNHKVQYGPAWGPTSSGAKRRGVAGGLSYPRSVRRPTAPRGADWKNGLDLAITFEETSMATIHAARYGAHPTEHGPARAMPGLIYGVIMSGIWAGILMMVSPLLFR